MKSFTVALINIKGSCPSSERLCTRNDIKSLKQN